MTTPETKTDSAEQEQSPLDADSPPRVKRASKAKQRKVREFVEDVPLEEREREANGNGHGEEPTAFEDDSPLDADAEAALQMCEVERVGPGEGPGWVGRLFDYGDVRGPVAVSYGRVGSYPRTRDIYERITQIAGGGQYKFVTRGKAAVFKVLPTPPLPLPSEQQAAAGGFHPAGGFQGFGGPGIGQNTQDFGSSPDGIDEEGFWQGPTGPEQDEGWVFVAARNNWKWAGRGRPLGPPPAAPGGSTVEYDHRGERRGEDRLDKLEKLIERMTDSPKTDPMAAFTAMMTAQAQERKLQLDADRLRWEQEREERDKRRSEEAKLNLESVKAKSAADQAIALAQAEASKAAASAQVQTSEKIAAIQAESNKQLMALMTQKSDTLGEFSRFADAAQTIFGAGKNDNPAVQISEAVRSVVPTVAESVRDTVYAVRGLPIPMSGGAQGVVGQQQPSTEAAPAPGQVDRLKMIQLTGYFVNAINAGMKPAPSVLAHGLLAFSIPPSAYPEIRSKLVQATPEIVVGLIATTVRQLGNVPAEMTQFPALAQQVFLSPQGRAWFGEFQRRLREDVQKETPAPPPPQVPAAPATVSGAS